ncbi:pyruvate dehydrogenase (acetyl-transferring), homodimeric type [Pelagibaculum spongiae]|uniref:Pyruvate dehydrogenase E1 component n=1 Tax=Pelagibaculum spongiae TaxID=2080658 RepID=A0A2V1H5B1_9GAMM|nr:pyruvate dehydrogenase (acetyl-transferring), homodimeric type [Pelagibaculum spongiae]PVZ71955.1 pyruvate dehydrogenase (acetyl-transferring), homodimeric type [Pelagibaculum spongiae]
MAELDKFDLDPEETREWIESLQSVLEKDGPERAHYLLEELIDKARRSGAYLPYKATTAYINTIPTNKQTPLPGDASMERRIRSLIRWNAMAMVIRANQKTTELGGHLSSFASSATLYDIGFNHFWKGPEAKDGADLVYIQGHCAPGIYARSFLEGRLGEDDLELFRQEANGKKGLSSYPHPRLMPDYWQFSTVSMGLGPIQAIYQARFLKYMEDRGLIKAGSRKVWCFCGDGEMDEPESQGAIALAGREKLDNLIFVINCNLQRLDGPVRGNGKIIQELEGNFRGAGWNAVKVIWGRHWDPLLARDNEGLLLKRMEEVLDGDYQTYKAHDGAYVREHFFGKSPELKEMVAGMSDDDVWRLNRGGHDPHKVYAAYAEAVAHKGQPTVILAKTIKGYGMGDAGEALNKAHQTKKMNEEHIRQFRDRFDIPITDAQLEGVPYYRPADDSPEMKYLQERRQELGGYLPHRNQAAEKLPAPALEAFAPLTKGSGEREMSTTMAFVRMLNILTKDKNLKDRLVPIVPDEARTFGMEGLFRQLGIYSSVGQLYRPVDADQVMFYKEDKQGQILEEGINEAGAFSSWLSAATSYSTNGVSMLPFYIYYSMFGFQRIGDLAWAAGDMNARGFLIGATAGRTTLAGEGLQHQDGHGMIQAGLIPNCVAYDPCYAHEMAVIVQDGIDRMMNQQENVFYYITAMNENYTQPALEAGTEAGILKGGYKLKSVGDKGIKVQLMGGGTILREVEAAAEMLAEDFGIQSDVWSITSFNELKREADLVERENLLNPEAPVKLAYITELLKDADGPVIAATDYMRGYPEQIRPFLPTDPQGGERKFTVLGTDGFGRSDTRAELREFFEVDRRYVVLATLKTLADQGRIEASVAAEAIKRYGIDNSKPAPWTV